MEFCPRGILDPRRTGRRARGRDPRVARVRRAARGSCNSPSSLLLDSLTPPGGTLALRGCRIYAFKQTTSRLALSSGKATPRRMRERLNTSGRCNARRKQCNGGVISARLQLLLPLLGTASGRPRKYPKYSDFKLLAASKYPYRRNERAMSFPCF